jgi:hypothetical protein
MARLRDVDVEWAATDPVSGRFSAIYATSTVGELEDRLDELRARGEGYVEVARAAQDYPTFMMGFRGAHAVLYRLDDAETMLIHVGDGSVPKDGIATVLVMENDNEIDGQFALSLGSAWGFVKEFAASASTGDDSEWLRL